MLIGQGYQYQRQLYLQRGTERAHCYRCLGQFRNAFQCTLGRYRYHKHDRQVEIHQGNRQGHAQNMRSPSKRKKSLFPGPRVSIYLISLFLEVKEMMQICRKFKYFLKMEETKFIRQNTVTRIIYTGNKLIFKVGLGE